MGEVVSIKEFNTRKAIERAQGRWRKIFPEELTNRTMTADLSDMTLLRMARLDEDVTALLYDLIMAVLGLGPGAKFHHLMGEPKLRVLDANLFFIDQIRWECMRRLGWLTGFPGEEYPLVELIMDCREIKAGFSPPFPRLAPSHPDYDEFLRRGNLDGESLVRGLIPAALAAFGDREQKPL